MGGGGGGSGVWGVEVIKANTHTLKHTHTHLNTHVHQYAALIGLRF